MNNFIWNAVMFINTKWLFKLVRGYYIDKYIKTFRRLDMPNDIQMECVYASRIDTCNFILGREN